MNEEALAYIASRVPNQRYLDRSRPNVWGGLPPRAMIALRRHKEVLADLLPDQFQAASKDGW